MEHFGFLKNVKILIRKKYVFPIIIPDYYTPNLNNAKCELDRR